MPEYRYHVRYSLLTGNDKIDGMCESVRAQPIATWEDVMSISHAIRDDLSVSRGVSVIIDAWHPLPGR